MSAQPLLMIAVARERRPGERRVALVPADVARLKERFQILVERGAGHESGFADEDYRHAGATVATSRDISVKADVILAVRAPEDEIELRRDTILISLGAYDEDVAARLRSSAVLHLALERLPRTTRAQAMDVLSSQASVAGYAAVLEGARELGIMLPMMTTAAGVIKPANVVALGAGVAGLQALATARRLGAQVHAFDVRAAAREQVESVGAKFIAIDADQREDTGTGGYARQQSGDEQLQLRRDLTPHLSRMDLIISTAQIPGRTAPLLMDEDTLRALRPGAVIVDLAVETGGNCVFSRPDAVVVMHGVRIIAPTNLPSYAAADSSRLFSANLRNLLTLLQGPDGRLDLERTDPITLALTQDLAAKSVPAAV